MSFKLFVSIVFALCFCANAFVTKFRAALRTSLTAVTTIPTAPIKTNIIVRPVFEDKCSHTGITLSRYMIEFAKANPEMSELESLISSIQTACKAIANVVERSSITGLTGLEGGGGSVNVQGEEQKRLDVITNDILKKALQYSGKIGTLASEEEDTPVDIAKDKKYNARGDDRVAARFKTDVVVEDTGRYVAVFDPLDGSSNVDAGIPTGTIFGIFDEGDEGHCDLDDTGELTNCLINTLKPGDALVASGYCLYSSSVFFCLTLGAGVNIFTLDRAIGEFVLTHENVRIPQRGKIYSFNQASQAEWDQPLQDYVTAIQTGNCETKKPYTLRYIGSMVGDVHRTLLYGGIFGYPGKYDDSRTYKIILTSYFFFLGYEQLPRRTLTVN